MSSSRRTSPRGLRVTRLCLGLAAVALTALLAPVAASAESAVFHIESYGSVNMSTTDSPSSSDQEFATDVGSIECGQFSATATRDDSPSAMALSDLVYDECEFIGSETDFRSNGCIYTLAAGNVTESQSSAGTVKLDCPEKPLEFEAEIIGYSLCTVKIPSQSARPVTFESDAGKIATSFDFKGLHYSYEGECGSGSNTNGTSSGDIEISAVTDDKAEDAVDLLVLSPAEEPSALFHADSTAGAAKTYFKAPSQHIAAYYEVECGEMTAAGTTGISSTSLVTGPVASSSCPWIPYGATLNFNNCKFKYDAGTWHGAGMSSGSVKISSCTNPVHPIEIDVGEKCTIKIGPGEADLLFTPNADGSIAANVDIDGLHYSYSDKGAPYCGEGSGDDGTYSADVTLGAVTNDGAEDPVDLRVGAVAQFKPDSADPVTAHSRADPSSPSQFFSTDVGWTGCNEYSGTTKGKGVSAAWGVGNIAFGECYVLGAEGEVDFNGCVYYVHAGVYLGKGSSSGWVDLVCPEGKAVELKALYWGGTLCTIKVPTQTNLNGVSFGPGGGEPETIAASADIGGMHYTYEGFCGEGSGANGTYEGEIQVSGVTRDETEPVDLSVISG